LTSSTRALRILAVEPAGADDFIGGIDDVAQHREQMLLDAVDHVAVDKCGRRRVGDLELDAPGMAQDLHVEVAVVLEDLLGVVAFAAGIEHRQRTVAKQRVQPGVAGIEQLVDLGLRQDLEAAARPDARVHRLFDDDAGLQRLAASAGVLAGSGLWNCRRGVQGRISIGVLSWTISHSSTMSAFDMAMQPSVQSAAA
jgi:hypothetical protein